MSFRPVSGSLAAPITLTSGFAAKSGLGPAVGFDLEGSGTGTSGDQKSTFFYLQITADTISQGSGGEWVFGELLEHHFGGSAAEGGRAAMQAGLFFDGGATNAANPNRNYVALQGQFVASNDDGGTLGGEKGAGFGLGSWAQLKTGATHFSNLTAFEANPVTDTGSSVKYLSGIQVAGQVAVNGSTYDAGYALSGLTGHVGFKVGFLIGDMNGAAALATTSTIMQAVNQPTLANGFDFSTTAFTGFFLNANGFTIGAPAGNHSIEIGRIDGVASTPFMDWHSGATAVDYDARILASGGSGVPGGGTLTLYASTLVVNPTIKTAAGNESTGAGSAALGANSPATTLTAPHTWIKFETSDGSTVYVPAWK